MSRVIKFRAWIPEEKRMEHFEFHITAYGETISFGNDKPHWIIMQFTGLHDKSGKEIYEGDIIRVPAECTWGYSGDHRYAEIRWQAPTYFAYNPADKYGMVGQDFYWGDVEVIGNIYENPELLEEK